MATQENFTSNPRTSVFLPQLPQSVPPRIAELSSPNFPHDGKTLQEVFQYYPRILALDLDGADVDFLNSHSSSLLISQRPCIEYLRIRLSKGSYEHYSMLVEYILGFFKEVTDLTLSDEGTDGQIPKGWADLKSFILPYGLLVNTVRFVDCSSDSIFHHIGSSPSITASVKSLEIHIKNRGQLPAIQRLLFRCRNLERLTLEVESLNLSWNEFNPLPDVDSVEQFFNLSTCRALKSLTLSVLSDAHGEIVKLESLKVIPLTISSVPSTVESVSVDIKVLSGKAEDILCTDYTSMWSMIKSISESPKLRGRFYGSIKLPKLNAWPFDGLYLALSQKLGWECVTNSPTTRG